MENTTKPRPRHLGRNIRHTRELLDFTQEELAKKMGVSQQTVSHIESSEDVDDEQLKKVAKALGVPADAIKNLDENAPVYNIVSTNHGSVNGHGYYHYCTFNPIDKWAEAIEENKRLYEELLKKERETVAMLKKMMEGKG